MKIFKYISEYNYWNRLIKRDRKIARLHGKWNKLSRKSYYLEQRLPDYCNYCPFYSKDCRYYSLVKKYRKNMARCEKIRKKLIVLEKERN